MGSNGRSGIIRIARARANKRPNRRAIMTGLAAMLSASTRRQRLVASSFTAVSRRRHRPLATSCTITCPALPDQSTHQEDLSLLPYFERLGNPRTVLAPMVSQSDLPFRLLCHKYGAQLSYTQMIHATNYMKSNEFRSNHLDVYPRSSFEIDVSVLSGAQMNALDGMSRKFGPGGFERYRADVLAERGGDGGGDVNENDPSLINPIRPVCYPDEGPVVVQLAGHDPTVVADAALDIVDRTDGNVAGIDLNCGCPQAIARKGRYGAFLMEDDPHLVGDVLSRLRQTLPHNVGVSAKIRLPIDETMLQDRIQRLVESGVDLITVHGRNLKENKTKVREANWDAIALATRIAREHSGNEDFPVVANGGIEYGSDVDKCLQHTGASAVMSSESLLENPALFATSGLYAQDDVDMTPEQLFHRQIDLAEEYLDLATIYPPVPGSLGKMGGSFNVVRSHVFKILYRYLEEHHDLRNKLADGATLCIPDVREILVELRGRYGQFTGSEWTECKSSKVGSSWYRRHRDAAQRVHRRGGEGANSVGSLDGTASVEDKKRIMKERIRKLKEQRERKEQQEERVAA